MRETKIEIVEMIAEAMNVAKDNLKGLEKANKTSLEAILKEFMQLKEESNVS